MPAHTLPGSEPGLVTIIHRPASGSGPIVSRSAFSRCAVPVVSVVHGLDRESLAAAGVPAGEPSTYIALGPSREAGHLLDAYVGESSASPERLRRHASDAAKSFIQTVHVVTWPERRQSQAMARYREARYAELIQKAGLARLVTAPPPLLRGLPDIDREDVEASLHIERILLWDAGCHILEPPDAEPVRSLGDVLSPLIDSGDAGAAPLPVWYELRYRDQFGLGLDEGSRFTVKAGTDVRTTRGKSESREVGHRLRQLQDHGVLSPIRGVADRKRLLADVSFPSISIAARVVTASHVYSDVWQPRDRPRTPLIVN